MQFEIDNVKYNPYQSNASGGGTIIINGGNGGGNYTHPLSYLWGNAFQAGDTLDGDLTSKGTIKAPRGEFENLLAGYGNFNDLVADDATIRNLSVTGAAHFVELIIDKINSTMGSLLLSPAHCEITRTEDLGNGISRCYFKATDGEKIITNDFKVDDLVICQEFNVKERINHDISNRFIWKRIVGVGTYNDYDGEKHYSFVDSTIDEWNAYDIYDNQVENISEASYIKLTTNLNAGHYKIEIESTSEEDLSYELHHNGGEFEMKYTLDMINPNVIIKGVTISPFIDTEEVEPENYFDVYTDNDYKVGEYNHKSNNSMFEQYDIVCVLGNYTDEERQKAILLSATNPKWLDIGYSVEDSPEHITPIESPAIITFNKVNRFSLANKHVSVLSPTYNLISADTISGLNDILNRWQSKFEQIPDSFDIYVEKNEIEQVGIHLDGENSTITAVADKFSIVTKDGKDVLSTDADQNTTFHGNIIAENASFGDFNIMQDSFNEGVVLQTNKKFNILSGYERPTAYGTYIADDGYEAEPEYNFYAEGVEKTGNVFVLKNSAFCNTYIIDRNSGHDSHLILLDGMETGRSLILKLKENPLFANITPTEVINMLHKKTFEVTIINESPYVGYVSTLPWNATSVSNTSIGGAILTEHGILTNYTKAIHSESFNDSEFMSPGETTCNKVIKLNPFGSVTLRGVIEINAPSVFFNPEGSASNSVVYYITNMYNASLVKVRNT